MRAVNLADVEHQIREQHEELRARLDNLVRNAGLPWALRAVRVLLRRFTSQFEAHLVFEEHELAPRIRILDAWGEVREAALLTEHQQQRKRLDEVCGLADAPIADSTTLANAIQALARDLLADMREEEEHVAELVRIEEQGHIDQMTG